MRAIRLEPSEVRDRDLRAGDTCDLCYIGEESRAGSIWEETQLGRVVISSYEEGVSQEFPRLAGVSVKGDIRSRGIITEPDRPLLLDA